MVFPVDLKGAHHLILPSASEKASKLVLFFGAKDLKEGMFNFFQLGQELSEHVAFINNGRNEWYQFGVPGLGRDFEETCDALRGVIDALGVQEVLCVGTSMGGWGAILFGSALNARVLAFASDCEMNDPISRNLQYFQGRDTLPFPDLRERLKQAPCEVTLLVGERDPGDLYAAFQLQKMDKVTAMSVVGCNHFVPPYLTRTSRMGPVLRSFVNAKPITPFFDQGAALTSKDYILALREAQKASLKKDWPLVVEKCQEALEALPFGEGAEILLGVAYAKQKKYAEALPLLAAAAASEPSWVTECRNHLAMVWRQMGANERAAQLSRQIIAMDPGNHNAHYRLAMIAKSDRQMKEAKAHIKRALQLSPKSKPYMTFQAGLEKAAPKG